MKIGLSRKENAKESWSVCTMETFMEKVKCETKGGYISRLRESIPSLQGSSGQFVHIDRIPRVYPIAEFRRTNDGGRKFKSYNGVVLVVVNGLSGNAEAEYVKSQAALLPQTLAALTGSSGRSAKVWVRFTLPDGDEQFLNLHHVRLVKVVFRYPVQMYIYVVKFPLHLHYQFVYEVVVPHTKRTL